ncbi:hypothetical protein J2T57_001283 [Natronocella acetinitrilica]|uniref:Uncharacterized protein n=1 Tax=Natronocella acetinitrilica TaxID=414046 RepID=A0AAE3KB34_9GAMM|nr:hypothetical protein [Natronocella acetinitrilica]MCP1674181.1 hypothetical protein [Natronocella acetinitrilica]
MTRGADKTPPGARVWVRVLGPREPARLPRGGLVVDLGAHAAGLYAALRPESIGPVRLDGGRQAATLACAMRYLRLYPRLADARGGPGPRYWHWAGHGLLGRGDAPLAPWEREEEPMGCVWHGEVMSLVDTTRHVFLPRYCEGVARLPALDGLRRAASAGRPIAIRTSTAEARSLAGPGGWQAVAEGRAPIGTAFALGMLLTLGDSPALDQLEHGAGLLLQHAAAPQQPTLDL